MARTVGDPTSFFFTDTRPGDPLSYEALQTRRKIAEQIAARRQNAYPKNVGEGIFSAADSLAGAYGQRDLEDRQSEYEQERRRTINQEGGATERDSSPQQHAALPPPTATEAAAEPAPVSSETRNAITAAAIPLPPPRPVYDRNPQIAEMNADPTLRPRLLAMAKGEVGDDPARQRVQLETAFNRAAARGQSLDQILLDTRTNPRLGYYPAKSFTRGQASEDVLTPVLRGSDEGGAALGFSPTGNASGDVAASGVRRGYYTEAGKLPGDAETYVQHRPDNIARLEASRVPGTPVNILPQAAGGIESGPRTFGDPYTQAPTRVAALGGGDDYRNPVTPAPPGLVAAPDDVRVAEAGTKPPVGAVPPAQTAPPYRLPPRDLPSQEFPPAPAKTLMTPEEDRLGRQAASEPDPLLRSFYANEAAKLAQQREFKDKANEKAWEAKLKINETERKLSQEFAQTESAKRYEYEAAERTRALAAGLGVTNEEATAISKDYIEKKRPAAETIAAGQDAIRNARQALSQGAITGFGADARINWSRLMSLMGQPDQGSPAANAQAFGILMQPVTNAQRAAAVGNTQISNADILMSKMAAGADVKLEPQAIFHILNVLEDNGLKHLQDYKERSESLFQTGTHRARRDIYGAPAFETEPQKLTLPPGNSAANPVPVWSSRDADRYPPETFIQLPSGKVVRRKTGQ